jgi:uncharacterized phiE125 gp8 family phage protein
MLLTVCSSATGDLLVSVADLKEAMDLTDAQHDETLTRFIRRSSSRIETYVGRTLFDQVYQVALPSYGGPILQLPRYPIRSVLRVFDGTDTGVGTELAATDYRVDYERGQLIRNSHWAWSYQTYADVAAFPEPGHEYPRWLVEFSAGYIPAAGKDASATQDGTTTTGSTVPGDLQDAAISLTRSLWYARTREAGITSKSVGELSVHYGAQTGAIPDEVAALLQPYRSLY